MANKKSASEVVEKGKLRKMSAAHSSYYCRENVLLLGTVVLYLYLKFFSIWKIVTGPLDGKLMLFSLQFELSIAFRLASSLVLPWSRLWHYVQELK